MSNVEQKCIYRFLVLENFKRVKNKILGRYCYNEEIGNLCCCIRKDFHLIDSKLNGIKIQLYMWGIYDTEFFSKTIDRLKLKCQDGIILVYDITQRETFNSLTQWLHQIEENNQKKFAKLLIGLNSNQNYDIRQVSYEEGTQFAFMCGMAFVELDDSNCSDVKQAIELLVQDMIKRRLMDDNSKTNIAHITLDKEISHDESPKSKCY